MQVAFDVDTKSASRWLRDISDQLDVDEIMDDGAQFMLDRLLTRFLAEKDPDGKPWPPSRAAIREHRRTLYKSGRLFRSIHIVPGNGETRFIRSDGVPYAEKHQFGIGVIQREFLGFDRKGTDHLALSNFIQQRIFDIVNEE